MARRPPFKPQPILRIRPKPKPKPPPSILGPILRRPIVKQLPRAPRGRAGMTPGQIVQWNVRAPKILHPPKPRPQVRPRPKVGTAATIPPHARTPAVASTRAVSASTAARAEAARKSPLPVARPPRLLKPARRPTRRPAVAPTAPTTTTTNTTDTTSATDDMTALINSILQPQYAAIDAAIAREQEINRQNLAVYGGLTGSYMKAVSGIPAEVSGDYSKMIGQTSALAQASADRLAAASPNADVQALLQAIGAPAEQQSQLATQNQNIFQGGGAVLAHTQGTIPAQALSQGGAAQVAYAHELPGIIAARGTQGLQGLEYSFGQNLQSLWDQRAQVAAQVPKLTLDIRLQQAAEEAKQQALELEAKALGIKTATARASIAKTRAGIRQGAQRIAISRGNLKVRQQTAKTSAQKAKLSNDFRFAEVYGYNPRTGQPTLAAIKASRADKAKGRKPPTATQRKNWTTFADQAYHGVAPKTHYDSSTGSFIKVPGTGSPPIQYYPSLKRLMSMGATLTQAQQTLNALYAKGEGGRPYVSLQGRIALEQAGMPLAHPMDVPNARQKAYLQRHRLWSD